MAFARIAAASRAKIALSGQAHHGIGMSETGKRWASSTGSALVELREYRLKTEHAAEYVATAGRFQDLRREIFPLRLVTVPETGGLLNVATHFYFYRSGHAERDAARTVQQSDPRWKEYSRLSRPAVEEQRSLLFVEAPLVASFGLHGMQSSSCPSDKTSTAPIYELRRYQLKLGYDTVPRFLEIYGRGLPSKLGAAGTDPSTSLMTLLYSDVGSLNEVID